MAAAAHNQPEVMALLLEASASLDLQTHEGETALTTAAALGADDCVLLLLDEGANTALQNNAGKTALGCAVAKSRSSTQLLLQRGSTPPPETMSELPPDAVRIRTANGKIITVSESSLCTSGHGQHRKCRDPSSARRAMLVNAMRD